MFKKRSLLIVFILALVYTLTLSLMLRVTKKSKKNYLKTLSVLQPTASKHYGASKRNYVSKDLWINTQDQIYHYLIVSKDSILHLNQTRTSETKVIEEMENITCYLQQKKYYVDKNGEDTKDSFDNPMQQVCVLKIRNGTYNYFNKHFLGDVALISVYQLPGHEITPDISLSQATKILDGECDNVSFFFQEDKPNLRTNNLKAHIFMTEEAI